VIRCWRAKDRVLNRDVAIRVHTPAGEAAHAWIARALTAGGLATPALAMVYDASEGTGDPQAPGGAAYVVNEWIDGETLADRLSRGPMPDRDVRTILRRLAEGVAEAHRVGLAVGGLTPESVVLRPNGLVGLRAVPAATGSIDGDIAALGALLEACLTGLGADGAPAGPLTGPSDLVALVRRARSTEPGQGLSSVAAMASLLAERPRTGPTGAAPSPRGEDTDSGWLRRLRERRSEPAARVAAGGMASHQTADTATEDPIRMDPETMPPVPNVRPLTQADTALPAGALGGDTIDAGTVAPRAGAYAGSRGGAGTATGPSGAWSEDEDVPFLADEPSGAYDDRAPDDVDGASRHKLVVVGLPLLALALVIALAWWIGSLLSVSGDVGGQGSRPSASAPAPNTSAAQAPAGAALPVADAAVFDPYGDGEPENDRDVPKAIDGDPASAWSTLVYRGSPAFGNLKPGVGLLLDLGGKKSVAAVTVSSTTPGATVEIRTGDAVATDLKAFTPAADGIVKGNTDFAFDKPVTARYVLVWTTGLVDGPEGFSADIAEVTVQAAG
jgi:serine/threonine protein kinase